MEISVVGTGYVGLVTAACLAEVGHRVRCVDKEAGKVASLLAGKIPFFEPQLDSLVNAGVESGLLSFTSSLDDGVRNAHLVFLAIGTPASPDGHADLGNLMQCVYQLAGLLAGRVVVAVKSTVPVGTCERIQGIFDEGARVEAVTAEVCVASNPEFLSEGHAVNNFRHPDRIVIGAGPGMARDVLQMLYAAFDPTGDKVVTMDIRSAEFAKYACNAMLAARVSMANELAGIAAQCDVDIESVCHVMRTDPRIGAHYLQPGAGYGGSCLPKDLRALISMANARGEPAYLLRSIERVNERQHQLLLETVRAEFAGGLRGRCIAVWGLAFKAGTDDVRAAPSLVLIRELLAAGARVQAYDPVASHVVRLLVSDPGLSLGRTAYEVCTRADALVVMTECEEFARPDFALLADQLACRLVFDARYLYEPQEVERHGLVYRRNTVNTQQKSEGELWTTDNIIKPREAASQTRMRRGKL